MRGATFGVAVAAALFSLSSPASADTTFKLHGKDARFEAGAFLGHASGNLGNTWGLVVAAFGSNNFVWGGRFADYQESVLSVSLDIGYNVKVGPVVARPVGELGMTALPDARENTVSVIVSGGARVYYPLGSFTAGVDMRYSYFGDPDEIEADSGLGAYFILAYLH